MSLKMILCGALALPLVFVGSALASGGDLSGHEREGAAVSSSLLDHLRPDARPPQAPVLVAQQSPAVNNIEEQLRELNGKVEELNFQVLQMQDQIRKMQQDNEFRFQQLEGNQPGVQGNTPPPEKKSSIEPAPSQPPAAAQPARQATASGGGDGQVLGAPPTTFGTITFDANGNVVGGSADTGILSNDGSGNASGQGATSGAGQGAVIAALPPADGPDELYRNSYQFILSGEYKTAEAGFRKHIEQFPNDPRAADAHFWLGEALLGEDRYRDAAEVFLKANRKYPDAKKAPDMLLKLGIALAAMNQRDVACATYGEIGQRYPDVSAALQQRIEQERSLAGC